jgi:hypothetical protein
MCSRNVGNIVHNRMVEQPKNWINIIERYNQLMAEQRSAVTNILFGIALTFSNKRKLPES